MLEITTRFEVVFDAQCNTTAVVKSRNPYLVLDTGYVVPAYADKINKRAQYKIINQVDFPAGKNYGISKIVRSNPDVLHADGFDIVMSPGKSEIEIEKELRVIKDHIRALSPMSEVRCVINEQMSIENVASVAKAVKKNPVAFIKLGTSPNGNHDFTEAIAVIKEICATPLILCSNISLDTFNKFKDEVKLFSGYFSQIHNIVEQAKMAVEKTPDEEIVEIAEVVQTTDEC